MLLTNLPSTAQYLIEGLDLQKNIYAWHDQALGKDKTGILLGEYQEIQRQSRETSQFFDDSQWIPNRLKYRGEIYDGIYLSYDIETDLLLIRHPTNFNYHSQAIKLIQRDVEWFEYSGHTFRYIHEPVLHFGEGFFDEMYLGESLQMFAKRIKITETDRVITYVTADKFIIRYQDEYHRLRSKYSVIKLLKPYKKEIRQFIKANQIKAKPEYESDMIQLISFCDELLNASTNQ
ncbi:MAG: hypothetical protein RIC30_17895 [Marinoscillum sp.]|uniref:hypothetical protein n=1 Tax=Marinoscillum sp. TaxID=2024838 RepID=UPI0032F7DC5D